MYCFAGPTIGEFSSSCLVIYVECDFVFWRKILKRIEVLCLIDLTQLSGVPLSWVGCLHAFCCWCCWCCAGSFPSLLNSSWEQRGLYVTGNKNSLFLQASRKLLTFGTTSLTTEGLLKSATTAMTSYQQPWLIFSSCAHKSSQRKHSIDVMVQTSVRRTKEVSSNLSPPE